MSVASEDYEAALMLLDAFARRARNAGRRARTLDAKLQQLRLVRQLEDTRRAIRENSELFLAMRPRRRTGGRLTAERLRELQGFDQP